MTIKNKTLKDPQKFIINREKWVRGQKNGDGTFGESALLNSDGNMCCLGFCLKASGFDDKYLADISVPWEAKNELLKNNLGKIWKENYLENNINIIDYKSKLINKTHDCTTICEKLMDINDNYNIYSDGEKEFNKIEDEREKNIKKLFKKIGINVSFTGKKFYK